MPYIEEVGLSAMYDQVDQWKGVMHDPMIDGYNGWACKQKLYLTLWAVQDALADAPVYHGEKEWLGEQAKEMIDKIEIKE